MKYYLIDEIVSEDMKKVELFLKETSIQSGMEKLFWVEIPEKFLDGLQTSHKECLPHVFAVELGDDFIKFELFRRSLNSFQCNCHGYCTKAQQIYVLDFADNMVKRLEIRT